MSFEVVGSALKAIREMVCPKAMGREGFLGRYSVWGKGLSEKKICKPSAED